MTRLPDFVRLAASHRFRVVPDQEGWPVIPGKLGHLEWHDGQTLAVYSTHPRVFARLWAIPGVRRWQVGDQEVRSLVPLERLPEVARLIQTRQRRLLTSETARKRSGLPTVRGTSAREKAV